jgi:hypothetical protein
MKYIPILLAALFLVSCAEQRVDGTTYKSYERSLLKMQNALKGDKYEDFMGSLMILGAERIVVNEDGEIDEEGMNIALMKDLDGMNVEEIIALERKETEKRERGEN